MNFIGGLRMRPEVQSKRILGITRSKAKMYEYAVPEEHHIEILYDPAELFTLTIGLLGEYAAKLNQEQTDNNELDELQKNILFSAHFFDSYLEAKLNEEIDPYLLLLGSAAYYLCDLPGSSKVLAKRIGEYCPDLDALGLEDLLLWLLQEEWGTYYDDMEGMYGEYINKISQIISQYFEDGNGVESLFRLTMSLRDMAYDNGSPRQVLFADVICAIVKKRIENSTWRCLPEYSGLSVAQWRRVLRKETFIRELWPAQHLLGKHGIFRGHSAVIQMPTSAGKTKAIEIILRSAFISDRTSIAIIVAPFRALCHEIKNSLIDAFGNEDINIEELSDVLQKDFLDEGLISLISPKSQIENTSMQRQVLVVTPEKLIYMLRQIPELASSVGLLIYDEGHQFDSGTRGITYELLLTSLKALVPEGIQTVLVSAVISNAEDIGKWLNGDNGEVVSGANLIPTYRTIAFASWLDILGRLEFVNREHPENNEFYVPRVIEQHPLQLRKQEHRERFFPEKNDGKMVALYLGLKLVARGSIALFCGTKVTASSICEKLADVYNRGLTITKPIEFSNQDEIRRLCYLHERNLGNDAAATKSARIGVFAHHANMPQGIRLAVEHAMKEGLAKFVVCTSTLAQGVNLPIRYLLVTSIYQGRERIKVRDFHNLIGRAGRSGMHTEGSILFTDPEIYDKKNSQRGQWKWKQVQQILIPENSEPCVSTLLSIFQPLRSDDGRYHLQMNPLELAQNYVDDPSNLESLISQTVLQHSDKKFTQEGLRRQVEWNLNIISSIESYLLAHWDDSGSGLQKKDIEELATSTLAYFLADEDQQKNILELFKLLANNVEKNVPEAPRRKVFGRTLYGVQDSIAIENWVSQNIEDIIACNNNEELLTTLWPIICQQISNKPFIKCDTPDVLLEVVKEWIQGKPFYELYKILVDAGARIIARTQRRYYKIEHVVDICENGLSYDGTLILGAVTEILSLIQPDNIEQLIGRLKILQKQLKYGLPTPKAITLYETGLSDRVVAMELCSILDENTKPYRQALISNLRKKEEAVREILSKYPLYFTERLDALL